MEATRRLIAGTVKSIIYVTTDSATACIDKKTLAPQVSACGQVSKWRSLRKDVEVALVEAIQLPDEE